MRSALASLRLRLLLLVLLPVIPCAFVIYESARDHRDDNRARVQEQALQHARIVAVDYANTVQSSQLFLLPLAKVLAIFPDLTAVPPNSCSPFFDDLIKTDNRFKWVGAVLPDGKLICGSELSEEEIAHLKEQTAFKQAIETGEYAAGESISSTDGQKVAMQTAYPILGPDGVVRGVVMASFDPAVISDNVLTSGLPEGSVITVVSRSGLILARYPNPDEWVGQTRAGNETFEQLLARPSGVMRESVSLEGTPILVASVGITGAEKSGSEPLGSYDVIVTVGIPRDEAYESVNAGLRNDLIALGAVAFIALVVAWVGSSLFLRPVRAFAHSTERLAEGDFTARVGPPYPRNELGGLGQALDDMATKIQARDSTIRQLNESLERRIDERTRELVEANKELESFSYSVSHDLRAPLRAISGFARILAEDAEDSLDEDNRQKLVVIQENARQMGDLIDDLLAFSRLTRQPVSRVVQSPAQLVSSVVEEIRRDTGTATPIEIGDLPPSNFDPKLMRQVWVNLISNAVKFSAKAENPLITIGAADQDGETVYFVRDNGVGFDMQYSHKLFGVFQRLHKAEEYEGTGVGLAIVHRIIQRHRGKVWAESTPGAGSTFYFTLGEANEGDEQRPDPAR